MSKSPSLPLSLTLSLSLLLCLYLSASPLVPLSCVLSACHRLLCLYLLSFPWIPHPRLKYSEKANQQDVRNENKTNYKNSLVASWYSLNPKANACHFVYLCPCLIHHLSKVSLSLSLCHSFLPRRHTLSSQLYQHTQDFLGHSLPAFLTQIRSTSPTLEYTHK